MRRPPLRTHVSESSRAIRRLRTARGWRLLQHGTVLSEILTDPGPTHSVFDVLAGAAALHPRPRRICMLGLGGGGTLAALRALNVRALVHGVDLDPGGLDLLLGTGSEWVQPLSFHHADALDWLKRTRGQFEVVVEDLSVPWEGEIVKPEATWTELPGVVARRLAPGGLAIFNLLRPTRLGWSRGLAAVAAPFAWHALIHFQGFHNRILLAAAEPTLLAPRTLGAALRGKLTDIRSAQTRAIRVSHRLGCSPEVLQGRRALGS